MNFKIILTLLILTVFANINYAFTQTTRWNRFFTLQRLNLDLTGNGVDPSDKSSYSNAATVASPENADSPVNVDDDITTDTGSQTKGNPAGVPAPPLESKSPTVAWLFRGARSGVDQEWPVPPELKKVNDDAAELLTRSLKLPHGKDEAWRHTNMRKLFAHEYQKQRPDLDEDSTVIATVDKYRDAKCRDSCLVFVNGRFSKSLSRTSAVPEGILATAFSDMEEIEDEIKKSMDYLFVMSPDADEEPRDSYASDIISNLNFANLDDAAVLYVAPGIKSHVPIQVLFCSTTSSGAGASASYGCLLAYLEKGSEVNLKQSFVTASVTELDSNGADQGQNKTVACFVNDNTRMYIGENARCIHTISQELSASSRYLDVLAAEVHHNASYDVVVLQAGSTIGRLNAHIDMQASDSNCSLSAAHLAGERQSLDLHSSINHNATECISRQQQRNVVADRGEVVFKGRIRIPKHAQMTDSAQLCRSIMIGQRARVIAMPTLEITADNVECSHGASVADLDENSMFYLASRGVDRQEARKLLLRAFVFDVLTIAVMDDASKERVLQKIESLYSTDEYCGVGTSPQKFISI